MDFTQHTYRLLLESLVEAGYAFQTFAGFIESPAEKAVILRHDVDRLPYNSLQTAQIENELGINGSYYFRIVHESYNENIIKQIAALGHEIGYHYEDLTLVSRKYQVVSSKTKVISSKSQVVSRKTKNDSLNAQSIEELGFESFKANLAKLREVVPVTTICMHGSPLSKYDSRDLWKHHDYRQLGIIGEPYFDVDFSKVLYLTDTGRRWDGDKVSVRDKINDKLRMTNYEFIKTDDIIRAANDDRLPNQIMITVHPQRWTNNYLAWTKELVMQNLKNVVKFYVVKKYVTPLKPMGNTQINEL